jgi:hypothetical protein
MIREFWNSLLTEKSWEKLQVLRREYDFILIGGWAVYLLTKQHKSKDIDIVVGINELEKLKKLHLSKNDSLKKYEIKSEEVDVDIYVEYFSKLAIPPEELKKYAIEIEGFKLASPEALIILKQLAYNERKHSVKGEKDAIDVLSILFFSAFNFKKYEKILSAYNLKNYFNDLKTLIKLFKDYNSLSLSPREFKLKKEKLLKEMRQL